MQTQWINELSINQENLLKIKPFMMIFKSVDHIEMKLVLIPNTIIKPFKVHLEWL